MTQHQCIDCAAGKGGIRPRPVVEGVTPLRCRTHLRELKTRQRKQARARHVERTYDITAEDNHELFLFQGGRCWLCRKATGATKSLAVDHDHQTNEVRGRLCGPCNQFIGKLGDDPDAARRLVSYLTGDTPYRRLKAQQAICVQYPSAVVDRVTQIERDGFVASWHADGSTGHNSVLSRINGVWTAVT